MSTHQIVSHEQWIEAQKAHLVKEKELTRHRDELARLRRELPWVRVEKDYVFDSSDGKVSLADLFCGRSQLFIYHFMFGPDWKEGCPSCSYVCDTLNGSVEHLAARDVTLTMISRAPLAKIEAFKKRMGWHFPWVSSSGNDFNHDFHVYFTPGERAKGKVNYNYTMQAFPGVEAPGASVFAKEPKDPKRGEVFHTFSSYGRGLDALVGTYTMLDMVPKGRDEDQLAFDMAWVRHHDRYATGELADKDRPYWPPISEADLEAGRKYSGSCCGSKEARS